MLADACFPGKDREADPLSELPPLPGPRTQRAVDRELAGRDFWLAAAGCALSCYRQRRPHAIPSFCQLARLAWLASELGRLDCGLDTVRLRPKSTSLAEDFEANLKRAYGQPCPAPLRSSICSETL